MIWLVFLPSSVALSLKIYVYWTLRRANSKQLNNAIVVMFVSLFIANATELLGLAGSYIIGTSYHFEYVLRLYYIATFWALASLIVYALQHAQIITSLKTAMLIYLATTLISLATAASDWIIAGFQPIMFEGTSYVYTIVRIKGEFYSFAQLWVLSAIFIASLGFTIAIKIHEGIARRRLQIVIWGLSPLLISVLIVVAAMELGVQFNMIFMSSICTSILLLILVHTEVHGSIFKFLSTIPLTQEWKRKRAYWHNYEALVESLQNSKHNEAPWKTTIAKAEHLMMQEIVNYHDGDHQGAADSIGVSISTVRRKLEE